MQKQTLVTKFFTPKPKDTHQSPVRVKNDSVICSLIEQQQFFCTPPTQEIIPKKKKANNLNQWIRKKSISQIKWQGKFLSKALSPQESHLSHLQISLIERVRYVFSCMQILEQLLQRYIFFLQLLQGFSDVAVKFFAYSSYNEKEFVTVLKRSSKQLKHIKKVKEMIKGQKISSFLEKTGLCAQLSENSQQQGSLLEMFTLEPKKKYTSVFLTDKDLSSICSESYKSLQYIQLTSCQFVTGKGFEVIAKCQNLTLISIQNNCHLKNENLERILSQISDLRTLMLLKCDGLSTKILEIIGQNCLKMQRLDIGGNPQLDLVQISSLKSVNLLSLSLKDNFVTNEALENLVQSCKKLHSLNLEGCLDINAYSLVQLQRLQLQRINLRKIGLREEDVYNFVVNNKSLKLLLVNNNLMSTRIEKVLQK